jgi:hypothetical protein
VGSGRPPHGSQQAVLPHWALASGVGVKALLWPGVQDTDGRQPSIGECASSRPRDWVVLAAASRLDLIQLPGRGFEPEFPAFRFKPSSSLTDFERRHGANLPGQTGTLVPPDPRRRVTAHIRRYAALHARFVAGRSDYPPGPFAGEG